MIMRLGLETFSYAPMFIFGKMDIFGFIRRAHELGLDGVQINIGLERDRWGDLGGAEPQRLRDVRALIEQLGLFVEIDTRTMEASHLDKCLDLCAALGADVLRTYASTPHVLAGAALRDYMRPGGGLERDLARAVGELRRIVARCADLGVRVAVENHEYETAQQVIGVIRAVDSDRVGTLVDTGNMMMVWEDPVAAVRAMAPYAVSTHFKDHAVYMANGEPTIAGVPLGRGTADCARCFRILAEETSLRRINIEVVYGYRSSFRCRQDEGGGGRLGEGAFRVQEPPLDPACVAPYADHLALCALGAAERERVLEWHERAVVESVEYVKRLNQRS